ncbi:type II secretion system F family protein [Thaumasiovibrio sp. DFM-14]|uniref:type II secretion system F family protein n=1 Tax=Thaumasiovibrio sp. DFM-14 TaxID=3384792 RepID=UPI0039A2D7F1
MDFISQLLSNSAFGDDSTRFITLSAIFLSSVLFFMALFYLATTLANPIKSRMKNLSNTEAKSKDDANKLTHTLESMDKYVGTRSHAERQTTTALLMHAGYHSTSAVKVFYAIKFLSAVIMMGIAGLLAYFSSDTTLKTVAFYMLMGAGLGSLLPSYVLDKKATARIKRLSRSFPDALDLLIVSAEAGLGFNSALNRVAKEISALSPELSDELSLVCQKMRVGMDLPTALKQFVARTGMYELQALVSVVSQSIRLGASLADTLREYAEDLRDKRMQKAEEEAAKIGTKMIFPLVTCIWPGFFAVAVGPGILGLIAYFSN